MSRPIPSVRNKNKTLEFVDLTVKHELLKDPRVHYRRKKSPINSGATSTANIPKLSRKECL